MPTLHLKSSIFILLLSLMCIQLPAQTPLDQKGTIEVQVMLFDNIKDIPLPAYCGVHITDAIIKYKVIKVINGFYLGNTIFINQKCVREAIENKTLANHITYIYKLKLIARAQEGTPDIYGIVL